MRGHMTITAFIPAPQLCPIVGSKVFRRAIRPRYKVSPIFRRQIDAIGLIVGGENDANAVENAVFMYVLFVDAYHVWRSSVVGLHMIIELITANIPQVARFVDTQNHTFEKSVEVSENLLRRNLLKIPGANSALHRLERSIFAGALLLAAD